MDQNIDWLEVIVNRWIKSLEEPQSPRYTEQTKDWLFGAAHILLEIGRRDLFYKAMAATDLKSSAE